MLSGTFILIVPGSCIEVVLFLRVYVLGLFLRVAFPSVICFFLRKKVLRIDNILIGSKDRVVAMCCEIGKKIERRGRKTTFNLGDWNFFHSEKKKKKKNALPKFGPAIKY